MVAAERLKLFCVRGRGGLRILLWVAFWWCVILLLVNPVAGLRPLRERTGSWNDEVCLGTCLKFQFFDDRDGAIYKKGGEQLRSIFTMEHNRNLQRFIVYRRQQKLIQPLLLF
ncbi:hypothetical protein D0Y65_038336 [Glycine soja]|uniref:Uncharacterized protein n=1 Tax=Glycine soja TaxID=3848 RepID=A0A445H4E2_GLYSO|nr:hypothetical protein D0Y65_038336 [Glycine soja]